MIASKLPTLDPGDRRLNPKLPNGSRPKGEGISAAINVAFTELRPKPDRSAAIDTQLMFGETARVYGSDGDWSLVQADRDNYCGWLESSTLVFDPKRATHIIHVPRTFFYPGPDMKLPHKGMRSMGSAVCVTEWAETRGTRFAILETGEAVIARHVRPLDETEKDFVSIVEILLHTPYLWAGTTAFGLDCSGLIKLAMFMCGRNVLRDSDMQAATLGDEIDPGKNCENVRRGDLIFWRGHVGICQGPDDSGTQTLIHANGHTMSVASEPLHEAIERIAYLYEKPIGVRRP